MGSPLCAVDLAERTTRSAGISDLFVPDHATAEDDAFFGARKHTIRLKVFHRLADDRRGFANKAGKHVIGYWAALGCQMAVGLALVHDRHHLDPEAARNERAEAKARIGPPVARIKLKCWTLAHDRTPHSRSLSSP